MALGPYALTTLGDLKAYLNITGSENDGLLEALIERVSELFCEFTNRNIAARDYHWDPEEEDYDPSAALLDGNGLRVIQLPQYPVNSITALLVNSMAIPRAGGYSESGWIDDGTLKASGLLRLRSFVFSRGEANVALAYNAGYLTVPKDLAQAAIEQAAFKFQEGFKGRLGVGQRSFPPGSIKLETGEFLPQVREVLERYTRRVVL
jgi:hypothetical protein